MRALLAVVVPALLVAARPVRGQPPLELVWRAPADCPPASDVRAEVDRLMGGKAAPPGGGPVSARATVARAGARWRVRIETNVDGVAGQRTFDGDSCASVASATALILAMAVNPEAVRGAAAKPPVDDRPPEPQVTAAPERTEEPVPITFATPAPPPAAPRLTPFIRPVVLASYGALPEPAVGIGAAVGVRGGRAVVEVFGHAWGERFAQTEGRGGVGGDFSLIAAGVLGCFVAASTRPEVALCGGGEVDRVDARGRGVTDPGTASATWVAAVASAGLRLPVGQSFAVTLDVGGAMPLRRPSFVLLGVGPVWQPAPVNARVGAGVALSF